MKNFWLKNSLLASIFLTSAFTCADYTRVIEFVDDGTLSSTGKKMHVCAEGFMSGIHVKKNDFLCMLEDLLPAVSFPEFPSPPPLPNTHPLLDDYNTKRQNMHACPLGMAMVGIHVKDNVLKCRFPRAESSFRTPNQDPIVLLLISEFIHFPPSTQGLRFGMHACPIGYVMTGVHVKNNFLLCTMYFRV